MLKVKIHELASSEFDDAIEWYEMQARGLGKRFKNAVTRQIKKLRQHPDWHLKENEHLYKTYVSKFPYKILFTL